MADHLRRIADLASVLGARACVFGALGLRDPGETAPPKALEIARPFFRSIAPHFASRGVSLCIEANPAIYNYRFLTHTQQALEFVRAVDQDGITLQFDTGTVFADAESPSLAPELVRHIEHVHVSQSNLTPVEEGGFNHEAIGAALRSSGYRGWISAEMKATGDWRAAPSNAYAFAHRFYL